MKLIALFLLTGPGLLAWIIEGDTKLENLLSLVNAAVKWIVNNFLIITAIYLVLNIHYGNITIGFTSKRMDDLWNTIYDVNFVAKYGLITSVLGVLLGLFERMVFPPIYKWLEQRLPNARN